MHRTKQKVKKPWFRKPPIIVSKRMKLVKSKETKLEKAMELLFKSREIEYLKQPSLFGHPDFQIFGTNVLVFCDSSFWHGRRKGELSGKAFTKNKAFWVNKLTETKKRDIRISRALRKQGYKVLRFWDTDIQKRPQKVISRIIKKINKREN